MIKVHYYIKDVGNCDVVDGIIHFWGAPAAAHQMRAIEDALIAGHTVMLIPFEADRVEAVS